MARTISAEGASREEEHGTVLEEARQAKVRHLDDPILSRFYGDIISVEKQEREDFRRWFDEGDSSE